MYTLEEQRCVEHVANTQRAQLAELRAHGIQPDPILLRELEQPGTDDRFGVNLIARPLTGMVGCVQDLRDRLEWAQPDQYYYPVDDLHLTLLEISHSQTGPETEALAAQVREVLPRALPGAPVPLLGKPRLIAGRSACALRLCSRNGALDALRQRLVDGLATQGVPIKPRYPPGTAHLTFMRYLRPISGTLDDWTTQLAAADLEVQGWPCSLCEWLLEPLYLTWGATWYGRRSRITQAGPHWLTSRQ